MLAVISKNVSTFLEALRTPTVSVVHSRHDSPVQARWMKSSHPFVKINVDMSWVATTNDGFTGAMVNDYSGIFIATWRYRFNAHTSLLQK